MDQNAINRISIERKKWRKEHPHVKGFFARPAKNEDGTNDLSLWHCGIPGKPNTDWENGLFKLDMHFPPNYPTRPPKCKFTPVLFHPNIYPSGTVCLSILNEEEDYQPSLTVSEILLGIQALLDAPNLNSPAQEESFKLLKKDKQAYQKRIREQTRRFIPTD